MDTKDITVGVVGLGLMGTSIVTCLLMAGHKVVAVAPIVSDLDHAEKRIKKHLVRSYTEGLCRHEAGYYVAGLLITDNYAALGACKLVIECTLENKEIKRSVYAKIEQEVSGGTILSSNTSAIPISELQGLTGHPARFIGLHWAEPSHTTRFLEIICGDQTDISYAKYVYELAHQWNKEPTLVRKDIRGFITNRLMYAMYREAFYLVEQGFASIEDVDRACRNNPGYWMTLVGVFRWMDLTGCDAYGNVMKDLFPTLNNSTEVPKLMQDLLAAGGKGISNGIGFYDYTPEEAALWEETFTAFSYEIRELALKYPTDVVKKKLSNKVSS